MKSVHIVVLRTGDEVEGALVRVGDGVGAADGVVVGGTVEVATDAAAFDAKLPSTTATHLMARVYNASIPLYTYLYSHQKMQTSRQKERAKTN